MANISNFIFFDQSSTSTISNPFGNTSNGGALTLQVDDLGTAATISLEVEGAVDMNNPNNYFSLKVISLENFKTMKTISSAGIYLVIISGVSLVRIKSNAAVGNFKAYAVSVE